MAALNQIFWSGAGSYFQAWNRGPSFMKSCLSLQQVFLKFLLIFRRWLFNSPLIELVSVFALEALLCE